MIYSISAHGSHEVAISLTGAGRAALASSHRVEASPTIVDTHPRRRETLPLVLQR